MNRITSHLQKMGLRQVLATFLVGCAFWASAFLGLLSYEQPAYAASSTPAVKSYQTDQNLRQTQTSSEAKDGLAGSLKDTAENVKEKLNLDQPLPESTKAFFKQVKGEDVTVEEPRPSGKGGTPQNN